MHGGFARGDGGLAVLLDDGQGLELVLVLGVVGIAEVADGVHVAGHALHQHVVVFRRGEVAAAGLGLADDGFGEVVERARIGTGAEQLDRLVGPGRVDLVPAGDLALGRGLPHLLQLGHGGLLQAGVLGVDDHGECVVRHRQLEVLDAGGLAVFHFRLGDRARGVGDVGLVAAELLEAAARAGDADGDFQALVGLLEFFGDRFGDRVDGAGTVDLDDLGCGRQRGSAEQREGRGGQHRLDDGSLHGELLELRLC